MRFFRVESSKNELDIDSTIKSSGRYSEYLQQEDEAAKLKCAIEDALDECNPNGRFRRRDCLFVFEELKDALIFSANIHRGNALIYEVSASCPDILHKGDMNLLDLLSISFKDEKAEDNIELLKNICGKYWGKQNRTHSPCFEYLLNQAKVEKLLCSAGECLSFHNEYKNCQCGYPLRPIEQSSVYQSKMKEYYK